MSAPETITAADLPGDWRRRARPRAKAGRSGVVAVVPATVGPFEITIPGDPIPKGRPRTFIAGGRVITTTPPETRAAEAALKMALVVAKAPRYSGSCLMVSLTFRLSHGRRVDADNLAKLVLDTCNDFLWDDDYQIAELHVVVYRYHPDAGTTLRVAVLGPLWTKPKRRAP